MVANDGVDVIKVQYCGEGYGGGGGGGGGGCSSSSSSGKCSAQVTLHL